MPPPRSCPPASPGHRPKGPGAAPGMQEALQRQRQLLRICNSSSRRRCRGREGTISRFAPLNPPDSPTDPSCLPPNATDPVLTHHALLSAARRGTDPLPPLCCRFASTYRPTRDAGVGGRGGGGDANPTIYHRRSTTADRRNRPRMTRWKINTEFGSSAPADGSGGRQVRSCALAGAVSDAGGGVPSATPSRCAGTHLRACIGALGHALVPAWPPPWARVFMATTRTRAEGARTPPGVAARVPGTAKHTGSHRAGASSPRPPSGNDPHLGKDPKGVCPGRCSTCHLPEPGTPGRAGCPRAHRRRGQSKLQGHWVRCGEPGLRASVRRSRAGGRMGEKSR